MQAVSVLFRPSFTSFAFDVVSTVPKGLGPRNPSFVNFTNYRKPGMSSVSVSSTAPPDKESSDLDCDNATSPIKPLLGFGHSLQKLQQPGDSSRTRMFLLVFWVFNTCCCYGIQ
ncbi:hypothetical protein ACJRO7_006969 [Eucalyptus globulus]|uniref:Uncharacterized protein n=1 Tax=Eucalyptus globulus TaxID=34317 RepID=A0ABD3IMY5_EUCGL